MKIRNLIPIIILLVLFFSNIYVFAVEDGTTVSLEVTEVAPTAPPAPGAVILLPDTTPPTIFNLLVTKITFNSATITWETDEQALCQLFWGKTQEYEQGISSEDSFFRKHLGELIGLSPATLYHFKIICQDTSKNESQTPDQKFTTLSLIDIIPPANVIDFEAIGGDEQITLKWKNPPDPDFKAVKIMRSEDFYPLEPWEGTVVYDDKGASFLDTGLENGKRYYYTAFAYDTAGNYASGAIASAIPYPPEIPPPPPPPPIPPPPPPPVPPLPPEIEALTLEDFDFFQEGKKIIPKDGKLAIDPEKPLTVSLVYEKVPEVLKTLMLTLQKQKEEKYFSFILRINEEKTAYQGIIMAPAAGIYPLILSILDYKHQNLKQIRGELRVEGIEKPLLEKVPWYKRYPLWKFIIYVLLALLALLVIIYLLKKAREKSRRKERIKTNL